MSEYAYKPSLWQQEAHACNVDELLGAGAAGVGKTLFLIMDPMLQVMVEHQRCLAYEKFARGKGPKPEHGLRWGASVGWAIHLRRELIDLQQTMAIAERMYKAVDPEAKFDSQTHTWRFKCGYRLTFGHCQNLGDYTRYLSFGFTHIGFDELTTFALEQYDGITSRLRTSDPVLSKMLRVRACSNPGSSPGSDPLWVRKRFVDPCPEGRRVMQHKVKIGDGEVVTRTRMYLPGKLADNPDPEFRRTYEVQLRDKPRHVVRAYLDGDWYYIAGSYFGDDFEDDLHKVQPFHPPADWPVWRALDWGFKTAGIVGWFCMDDDDNIICFAEWYFSGKTDKEVAAVIKWKEQRLGYWDADADRSMLTGPADTQIWEERGEADTQRKVDTFAECGIDWVQADKKDRAANAMLVLKLLRDHHNRTTYPGLSFTADCVKSIQCIRTIPTAKNPDGTPMEEPRKGGDDHAYDMVSYSCRFAADGRDAIPVVQRPDIVDELEQHRHKHKSSSAGHGYGSQYG